ncbi:MAG: SEC-C domain-containing protein [Clostridia bacterium]|nr:SEC-C domain-containing protein [Clostridia bacterium]
MIENDLDFSSEESLDMNFENFCEELIAFQNNVDKSIETKTYRCITEEAKTIYLANYEEVKNNCELITEEIKLVNNTEESKKFASVIKEYIARILEAANNKVYGSDEQIVMRSEKDEIGLFEIKLHIDDNSYEKDFRNNRFSTVISYKTANSLKEEYEKINNIIAEIENAKNINIYLDYEIEGNIKNYSLKHFIKYLDNTLENNLVYKVNNYNLDLEMGDVYCYNKFEKDLFNNFVKREWFVTNTSNKEYAISDWDLRNVIFNLKNTPEIVSKQVENQIKTYLDTMRNLHTLTGFESVIKKLLLILNNNKLELNNLTLQLLSKSTYSQTEYSYDFGTDNIVYNIRSAFYDGYTKEAKEIKENKISKVQMDNENAITIGRNDLCSCGSGKKYKKCCGKNN